MRPEAAAPELRDAAYTALLDALTLSTTHREALLARGLSERESAERGYRTLPGGGRTRLCRWLSEDGVQLAAVPGFHRGRYGWMLAGSPGLLIPVRNTDGAILAVQIRRDRMNGGPKYVWLSSAGRPGGMGSGAPCHVARPLDAPSDKRTWLTEGPLKTDIACGRLGAVVIGVAGVGMWRSGLETAGLLVPQPGELVVAFDMDWGENPHVRHHRDQLILAAAREGWQVSAAEWSGAKGIDDALVAGLEVCVRPVRVIGRLKGSIRKGRSRHRKGSIRCL